MQRSDLKPTPNSKINEKILCLADLGTVAALEIMAKHYASLATRDLLLLLTQKQLLQDGEDQPILKQIGNSDSYFYNFKWPIPDLNLTKLICMRVSNLDYLSHPIIAFFDITTHALLAEVTIYLNEANQIVLPAHPTSDWKIDGLKKLIEHCLGLLAPGRPCYFSEGKIAQPLTFTASAPPTYRLSNKPLSMQKSYSAPISLTSSISSSITPMVMPGPIFMVMPGPIFTEMNREPIRPPLLYQIPNFTEKGTEDSPKLSNIVRGDNICGLGGPSSPTNKIIDRYIIDLRDFSSDEQKRYIKTLRDLNNYLQEKFRIQNKKRTLSYKIEPFIQGLHTTKNKQIALSLLPPVLWATYYEQARIMFEQAGLNHLEVEKEGEVINPKIFYFVVTAGRCQTYVRYLVDSMMEFEFESDQKFEPTPIDEKKAAADANSAPVIISSNSITSKPISARLFFENHDIFKANTQHSSLLKRKALLRSLVNANNQILPGGQVGSIFRRNGSIYRCNFKWQLANQDQPKLIRLEVSNLLSDPAISFFDLEKNICLAQVIVSDNETNHIILPNKVWRLEISLSMSHGVESINDRALKSNNEWCIEDLKNLITPCLNFLAPGPYYFSLQNHSPRIIPSVPFQEQKSETKTENTEPEQVTTPSVPTDQELSLSSSVPLNLQISSLSSSSFTPIDNPLPLLPSSAPVTASIDSDRLVSSKQSPPTYFENHTIFEANAGRYFGLSGKSLLLLFATDNNQVLPGGKLGSIFQEAGSIYKCHFKYKLPNLDQPKSIKLELSNLTSTNATLLFVDMQENEIPVLLATVTVGNNKTNAVISSKNQWPADDLKKLISLCLNTLAPGPYYLSPPYHPPCFISHTPFQEEKSESKNKNTQPNQDHMPTLLSLTTMPTPIIELHRGPTLAPLLHQTSKFIEKGTGSPILPIRANKSACCVGGSSDLSKILDKYIIVFNDFPAKEWPIYTKTLRALNHYLWKKFRNTAITKQGRLEFEERTRTLSVESFINKLNASKSAVITKISSFPLILWAAYYKQAEIVFEQNRLNHLEEIKEGGVKHPKIFYFVATPNHCLTYVKQNPQQNSVLPPSLSLLLTAPSNPQTSQLSSSSSESSLPLVTVSSHSSASNPPSSGQIYFAHPYLFEAEAKRYASLKGKDLLIRFATDKNQILPDGKVGSIFTSDSHFEDSYTCHFEYQLPNLDKPKRVKLELSDLFSSITDPTISFFDMDAKILLAKIIIIDNQKNNIFISRNEWQINDLKELIEHCLHFLAPGLYHFPLHENPKSKTQEETNEKKAAVNEGISALSSLACSSSTSNSSSSTLSNEPNQLNSSLSLPTVAPDLQACNLLLSLTSMSHVPTLLGSSNMFRPASSLPSVFETPIEIERRKLAGNKRKATD